MSLGMHAAIFGAILGMAIWKGPRVSMGSVDPMGGAIGIGVVNSIPLPQSSGERNPVADPTQAETPRDTEKQLKEQKDREKALEKLLDKDTGSSEKPKNVYKDKREIARNQLTTAESHVSSPLFGGAPGSGGVGVGSSTLGSQFGAYMDAVQQRISSKWRSSDVDPRLKNAPQCIVEFEIRRDGQVENVKVSQSSGNVSLDISAKRAIEEASPFDPLPREFSKSKASIEVGFKLKR